MHIYIYIYMYTYFYVIIYVCMFVLTPVWSIREAWCSLQRSAAFFYFKGNEQQDEPTNKKNALYLLDVRGFYGWVGAALSLDIVAQLGHVCT